MGVLEPLQASPVIIEDNVFVGSRCIVVEGVHVKKEAVLGANVVLTKSTKIFDVSKNETVEIKSTFHSRKIGCNSSSYSENLMMQNLMSPVH